MRSIVLFRFSGFRSPQTGLRAVGRVGGRFRGSLGRDARRHDDFPALVQLRSDPPRQVDAALDASVLLSFFIVPFAMLQAAIAAPLITSLFGERWAAAIPVSQLLSIGLAIDAVSWMVGTLLSARGDFRAVLRYALIQVPIFFALVVIGAVLDEAVGVA